MKTITLMLSHVSGAPFYTGHPDLDSGDAYMHTDPHRLDVSVSMDTKSAFRMIGSVAKGGEPLAIPGTTILVPYQPIEDQLILTLIVG